MKNTFLLVFIFLSITSFAQEKHEGKLLDSDTTWGVEEFVFPLGFAREIELTGVEEAYFPKGWSKVEHDDFWSYAFVWKVDLTEMLTEQELETDIELYFDGLQDMNQNGSKEVGIVKSTAFFIKTGEANGVSTYAGKVRTFDRFSTKKPMTLNVLVEQSLCEETKKAIILFKFSPKTFEHAIWKKLEGVKSSEHICDNK